MALLAAFSLRFAIWISVSLVFLATSSCFRALSFSSSLLRLCARFLALIDFLVLGFLEPNAISTRRMTALQSSPTTARIAGQSAPSPAPKAFQRSCRAHERHSSAFLRYSMAWLRPFSSFQNPFFCVIRRRNRSMAWPACRTSRLLLKDAGRGSPLTICKACSKWTMAASTSRFTSTRWCWTTLQKVHTMTSLHWCVRWASHASCSWVRSNSDSLSRRCSRISASWSWYPRITLSNIARRLARPSDLFNCFASVRCARFLPFRAFFARRSTPFSIFLREAIFFAIICSKYRVSCLCFAKAQASSASFWRPSKRRIRRENRIFFQAWSKFDTFLLPFSLRFANLRDALHRFSFPSAFVGGGPSNTSFFMV